MSEYGIVWSVMAPAAIPALVTAFGIFSVVAHWNDYFWPLIAVGERRPLHAAARHRPSQAERRGHRLRPADGGCHYRHRAAGRGLLIAQRRFVEGIVFTGMKG